MLPGARRYSARAMDTRARWPPDARSYQTRCAGLRDWLPRTTERHATLPDFCA
jgi:hypothetical protein